MDKIYQLIGLAQRAGKVSSGTDLVTRNLHQGKVKLLILSKDISEDVKMDFLHICEKQNVTSIVLCDKIKLGLCIGKGQRVAVAILDQGFANGIIKEIHQFDDELNMVEVAEWRK